MKRPVVTIAVLALVVGFAVSRPAVAAPGGRAPQQAPWLDAGPAAACVAVQRPAPSASATGQAWFLDTTCGKGGGVSSIEGCCERRAEFCQDLCPCGISQFTCADVQNGCSSLCRCKPCPV